MRSIMILSTIISVICLVVVGALGMFVWTEVSKLQTELAVAKRDTAEEITNVKTNISEAKASVSLEFTNIKTSINEAKKAFVSDYNDIKDRLIINEIEERRSNLSFSYSVLDIIQKTDAIIINKNLMASNQEFTSAEWAGNARMEARVISAIAYDYQEILSTLSSTKFGDSWLIQEKGRKREKLYDWLSKTDYIQRSLLNKKQHSTP